MNWESKIDHALKVLDLKRVFEGLDYGSSVSGLAVVFMCRDPALNFKQRIRYSKKEKSFSMDIMLDLPEMIPLCHVDRRRILAERLLREIPKSLRKYRLPHFDYDAFESDWKEAVTDQLLGPNAARFDHLCKPQATI